MKALTSIAVASVLVIASVSSANAWSRNRTTTGPAGGVRTFSGNGSCANGSCSSNQKWTGPRGYSATRNGSTNCSGGTCNGTATWTGPRGNNVTRDRSISRY